MGSGTLLLGTVIVTALVFDFTNGFHDTANAMAASISTGALRPRVAVTISALLNFVGAFLSLSVAATIAKGIVDPGSITLTVVFAGLIGGVTWNLVTWFFGIPSSSSHALIGGVVGATLVASGSHAVHSDGLISKVVIPAVLAPLTAGLIATVGTFSAYRITRRMRATDRDRGYKVGQVGSACLVSLAHGTNDAQKTMGIITLALITNGSLHKSATTPTWVIVACAVAIASGTYLGGWRIIRTVGKGLVDIAPTQGFTADSTSASVILASTHFGFPLSTTHVCSGSVMGTGVGRPGAAVRWSVARRLLTAWVLTLPGAALVGCVAWLGAHAIGGATGALVIGGLVAGFSAVLFVLSRKAPVTSDNVTARWTGSLVPADQVVDVAGAGFGGEPEPDGRIALAGVGAGGAAERAPRVAAAHGGHAVHLPHTVHPGHPGHGPHPDHPTHPAQPAGTNL